MNNQPTDSLCSKLRHIRIVLVNPQHPGNIGSSARAMKNMGLSELYLVDPKQFPHPTATAMACKADDIITNSTRTNSVQAAIKDCTLVIGTSARDRSLPWPSVDPQGAAELIRNNEGEAAILFGREDAGLYNEELQQCHYHLTIPTESVYSSLNLSQAVQVVCYELRKAYLTDVSTPINDVEDEAAYPSAQELEFFYEHLSRVLSDIDFYVTTTPRNILSRMRRLFTRARVDARELSILRGILSNVEKKLEKISEPTDTTQ